MVASPNAGHEALFKARKVFAQAVLKWFAINDWPQRITEQWAKLADVPGPWASQISMCVNVRLEPRPQFFISLAAFNLAVGTRDLQCCREDAQVYNRLINAQPFLMPNGIPANETDFFGMFIGKMPIPTEYAASSSPELWSAEQTDFVVSEVVHAIDIVAEKTLQSRPAVMQHLKATVFDKCKVHGEYALKACLKLDSYTADDLMAFEKEAKQIGLSKENECSVIQSLLQMAGELQKQELKRELQAIEDKVRALA